MITHPHNHHEVHQAQHIDIPRILGFWVYILSDCILFSVLFATFAVLHNYTYGNISIKDFTNLSYVLGETLFLLTSSFTYGLAILALYKHKRNQVINWLIITFLLGLGFIVMEVNEFVHLILEGHSWQKSAALSSFFILVGTHGCHVTVGLIWMIVLIIQLLKFKITPEITRRLTYLALFWSFLDIVWIFVFTIVYLMSVA